MKPGLWLLQSISLCNNNYYNNIIVSECTYYSQHCTCQYTVMTCNILILVCYTSACSAFDRIHDWFGKSPHFIWLTSGQTLWHTYIHTHTHTHTHKWVCSAQCRFEVHKYVRTKIGRCLVAKSLPGARMACRCRSVTLYSTQLTLAHQKAQREKNTNPSSHNFFKKKSN